MWGGKGWRINKFIEAGLGGARRGGAGHGWARQGMGYTEKYKFIVAGRGEARRGGAWQGVGMGYK